MDSRFNTDYIVGSKVIEVSDSEIQVLLVSVPLQTLGLSNSLSGRACDFCDFIKTTSQYSQNYLQKKYILKTIKHSIFQNYSHVVDLKHHRHKDIEKVKDMLIIANEHKNMVVLCDGIYYPDGVKRHFYLRLIHKQYLNNVVSIIKGENLIPFFESNNGNVYLLNKSIRSAIVIKGVNLEWIFHVYLEVEKLLGRSYSLSKYPFINCFTYKYENNFYLVVYPRVVHKPMQYYDSSSAQVKIIPGALELSGLFVTDSESGFQNLNKDSIKSIFEQISYSFTNLMEIIAPLKLKLLDEYNS